MTDIHKKIEFGTIQEMCSQDKLEPVLELTKEVSYIGLKGKLLGLHSVLLGTITQLQGNFSGFFFLENFLAYNLNMISLVW